jgi:hypothetical protein
MAKQRSFSFEFKRQVVLDFLEAVRSCGDWRAGTAFHDISSGSEFRSTRRAGSTMKWLTPHASWSMRLRSPSSSARSAN